MEKISFDVYFMSIAFLVAQRSFDPNTKCGCVLVSKDNRILSTGYNGPIKGSDDKSIPLSRPSKYYHFIHSEINSLLAYGGSHFDIQDGKAYVTIRPCHACLRALLQKGIKEIYYSNLINAKCVDKEDLEAQKLMLENRDVIIKEISHKDISSLLGSSILYIDKKSKEI